MISWSGDNLGVKVRRTCPVTLISTRNLGVSPNTDGSQPGAESMDRLDFLTFLGRHKGFFVSQDYVLIKNEERMFMRKQTKQPGSRVPTLGSRNAMQATPTISNDFT